MAVVYVARSAKLSQWGSDVGLSKHLFKLGCAEEDPAPAVAAGWAGETDWTLLRKRAAEGVDEAALIARVAAREKMVDPNLYPKLRGTTGIFKVIPARVENHILVARALASEAQLVAIKLKPADFADYLLKSALGS